MGHYCRHGFSNVCPANTYDTTGATGHSCTSCPEGTYSNTTGSTGANSCLPCQQDIIYKPMYSNVSMQVCAKGMYQGQLGASECLDCSVGTYQDSLEQQDVKVVDLENIIKRQQTETQLS